MEALLDEYHNTVPENMYAWLWRNRAISDLPLEFFTDEAVSVDGSSRTISTTLSSESDLLLGFGKMRLDNSRLCSNSPTSAAARITSQAAPSCSIEGDQELGSESASHSQSCSVQPTPRSDSSEKEQILHLHAAVLCSNSMYFRARITSAVGVTDVCQSLGGSRPMLVAMEESECDAATALLEFFYTSLLKQRTDGHCSALFLLDMMKVADRWQAPHALTAISSLLCKLQPDLFPIAAAFSLLQESPDFDPIKSFAKKSLFDVFGDAYIVATTPALTRQFLLLPHTAVLELLKSDELVTDAEATVLLLLCEWGKGKLYRTCSVGELEQLHSHIRYSRVSIPYLTELCESLHGVSITPNSRMELLFYLSLPSEGRDYSCEGMLSNPKAYYLPPRKKTSHTDPTVFLRLELSEAQLSSFLREARMRHNGGGENLIPELETKQFSCKPRYCQGFWITLELSARSGKLWCGLVAQGASNLLDVTVWSHFYHGIQCKFQINIKGTAGDHVKHCVGAACAPVSSLGWGDTLRGCVEDNTLSPMDLRWWEPYMINHCVTFEAEISIL